MLCSPLRAVAFLFLSDPSLRSCSNFRSFRGALSPLERLVTRRTCAVLVANVMNTQNSFISVFARSKEPANEDALFECYLFEEPLMLGSCRPLTSWESVQWPTNPQKDKIREGSAGRHRYSTGPLLQMGSNTQNKELEALSAGLAVPAAPIQKFDFLLDPKRLKSLSLAQASPVWHPFQAHKPTWAPLRRQTSPCDGCSKVRFPRSGHHPGSALDLWQRSGGRRGGEGVAGMDWYALCPPKEEEERGWFSSWTPV